MIQETAGVEKIPFWPITNSPTLKNKFNNVKMILNIINDSRILVLDQLTGDKPQAQTSFRCSM